MRTGKRPLLPALILLIVSWCFGGCSGGDDVEAVREMVREGAELAEKQDLRGLMNLTVDDFVAMPGEMDRTGTKAVLWRSFRYFKQFRIFYPQPLIVIEEDVALVSFPFLVVREGQSVGGLKEFSHDPKQWIEAVGNKADLYHLDLEMVRDGRSWKVRSAQLANP